MRRQRECLYEGDEQEDVAEADSKPTSGRRSDDKYSRTRSLERSTSPVAGPSTDYFTRTWFDHMLTFFGTNNVLSRRIIGHLLDRVIEPTHHHWFQLCHVGSVRNAVMRQDLRETVNPALAFALVSMAIRQRSAKFAYGLSQQPTSMIPVEIVPPPSRPNDISDKLKQAADAYLAQAIVSADQATGSWLEIAQAAMLLMHLEPELSPAYLHYLQITLTFTRAPGLQAALESEAKQTTGNTFQDSPMQTPQTPDVRRSSIKIEEAARLRLFPLWLSSRLGMIFPNVELRQLGLAPGDVDGAFCFAPWPDEPLPPKESPAYRPHAIQSRILGLNLLSVGLKARFLPLELDYTEPSEDLGNMLRRIDVAEQIFGARRPAVDLTSASYARLMMLRFCTSVCHLHGIILRRTGLVHSTSLRSRVVARIQEARQMASGRGELRGRDEVSKLASAAAAAESDFEEKSICEKDDLIFDSPTITAWPDVQQLYMTELDVDYIAHCDGHPLHTSQFQLDVLRLCAAATVQLRDGVVNTLRVAGCKRPLNDPIVVNLSTAASEMQDKLKRHTKAMKEEERRRSPSSPAPPFSHSQTTTAKASPPPTRQP